MSGKNMDAVTDCANKVNEIMKQAEALFLLICNCIFNCRLQLCFKFLLSSDAYFITDDLSC